MKGAIKWKTILLTLSLSAGFSLMLVLFTGSRPTNSLWAYAENLQEKIQTFRLIVETIQRSYVEERSADELLEAAIHGMLQDLDPHSNYLPPDNFRRWNKSFEGFTGIGVHFDIINDYPVITGFVKDSPASRSNFQTGDRILKINELRTRSMTRSEVEEALMGSPFDTVRLAVSRGTPARFLAIAVKKSHLNLRSIEDAYLLNPQTGYVSLTRFTGTTARELDRALQALKAKGMKNLILDLRDNGGGYLSAAVDVADRFLPQGRLIVYTKGRLPRSFQQYRASRFHTYDDLPVVILLNHGTASAAEIVAGALQDWDRALIVGTTSFGKGLVQSQYRFRDGSALLVTTAKYYTPLGRLIQRNYEGLSKDEYYAAAYKINSPSAARKNSNKRAYKTPMGRVVYGGGGITPDLWVENRDAVISDTIRALYFSPKKYFTVFAIKMLNRMKYMRRYTPRQIANLTIGQQDLQTFHRFLRQNACAISPRFFWRHTRDIAFLLKRELAYLLGGEEARFWVNYSRDEQLQVASANVAIAQRLLYGQPIAQAIKHTQMP